MLSRIRELSLRKSEKTPASRGHRLEGDAAAQSVKRLDVAAMVAPPGDGSLGENPGRAYADVEGFLTP